MTTLPAEDSDVVSDEDEDDDDDFEDSEDGADEDLLGTNYEREENTMEEGEGLLTANAFDMQYVEFDDNKLVSCSDKLIKVRKP